ncbi:MAG: beta-ureidopropionase / N-carbamoyl-L-amino-acid hydrolase [Gaiellales bacterium]|jgi:N-carbamoyl-L-amino-acid hydrolase|nr:beta-ureidopropionase / N-carbamoyl-L-amino-acid hydrolase [Gaiellales bacterium]
MPDISPQRFESWFEELAGIGHTDTGWNRVAWTPLEAEARAWFTQTATSLGLEVRQDGAGTLWAVTEDAVAGPWVCAGSHLDTQPDGGAYDGALGVVSALEAAATLLESGAPRRHPLAVVAFVDEEGARFRTPTFASLAITGQLEIDRVLEVMGDAPAIYGVTRDSLARSREQLDHVRSFFEIHVEQGRSLVDRSLALGVADVLAPRQRWRVEFTGEANHAGTTAMAGRRDALLPAAQFVLAVDEVARANDGGVGTVGRVEVSPGSTNSIPGHVAVSLDVRALEGPAVDRMVGELQSRFPDAEFSRESANAGARFDDGLRGRLYESASARDVPAGDLPSYAGHDAGILAPFVPSAMLFVRNPTGASHTPSESAADEDCVAAVQVLTDALGAELAS